MIQLDNNSTAVYSDDCLTELLIDNIKIPKGQYSIIMTSIMFFIQRNTIHFFALHSLWPIDARPARGLVLHGITSGSLVINMDVLNFNSYVRMCWYSNHSQTLYIFSCDQAALWMVFSVRLSVCPSVRLSVRLSVCPSVTPFWLCSHHRIIMKFSGVITLDQGKVHAKGQGLRSKVKVTEVTTQIFVSGL